ncbi:MAG: hypothetical protein H6R10_3175 [Rhodocyclaceae bacterium]|nr:hypothetical protein [Rhodocyclaceae bacterium]
MDEQTKPTPKKRGPKPIGEAPMTSAERQRRRRELLRAEGSKDYLLRLNGLHQEWVEILAKSSGTSGTKALQDLIEVSLDRYIGVMHRCERLREKGASDAEIEAFIKAHFLPALPPID